VGQDRRAGPRAQERARCAQPFNQGWAKGGAKFNRLEGCWEDNSTIFFVSTSGGDVKNGDVNAADGYAEGFGQVWAYRPRAGGGTLTLVYESPDGGEMDSPDNLTVTPRGGLIACEDDASSAYADTHPLAPGIEHVNRLIGLTRQHLRPLDLRRAPDRGDDVRGHRAVAPRAAVIRSAISARHL
jgi:hypothetical protein